jgi:hypothetical protein
MQPDPSEIPYGFCHCGCGGKTDIAKWSNATRGWTAGEPKRFIHGHHMYGLEPNLNRYIIDENGCWVWQASRTSHGYGRVSVRGRVMVAHRAMYEKYIGPVPDGLELDHLCRNPPCCNPAHMEPVTHAENMQRGKRVRFTWDQIYEIREMGTGDAARKFGITRGQASQIRRREVWKD